MSLPQLAGIVIITDDVPAATQAWRQLLGLEFDASPDSARSTIEGVAFHLLKFPEPRVSPGLYGLALAVDDLDGLIERLQTSNVEVEVIDFELRSLPARIRWVRVDNDAAHEFDLTLEDDNR